MKTKSKLPKALALVLLLGIGIYNNSNFEFVSNYNYVLQTKENQQIAENNIQKEKQSTTAKVITIVGTVINYLASSR